MATLMRVSQRQLLAHVRKHGETEVYLIASKMYFNAAHAYKTTLVNTAEGLTVVKGSGKTFHDMLYGFMYYNCTFETGYYAHYYIRKV